MARRSRAWCSLALVLLVGCGGRSSLGLDDTRDADPSPSEDPLCVDPPVEPEALVDDQALRPDWVGIRDDEVIFGARDELPVDATPTGGIHRVALTGGTSSRLELAFETFAQELLLGDDFIAYREVLPMSQGAASWSFSYPAVVVETELGEARRFETSLDGEPSSAVPMARLSADEVLFARRRSPPDTELSEVWLYDVGEDAERRLLDDVDLRRAASSGDGAAYLYLYGPGGQGLLWYYDGEISLLTTCDAFNSCELWTADDRAAYFRRGGTVEAWTPSGMSVEVAQTTAQNLPIVALDRNNLYWATGAQIRYVPRAGGEPQILIDGTAQFVEGMASNGCRLVYATVNPPRVWVAAAP